MLVCIFLYWYYDNKNNTILCHISISLQNIYIVYDPKHSHSHSRFHVYLAPGYQTFPEINIFQQKPVRNVFSRQKLLAKYSAVARIK